MLKSLIINRLQDLRFSLVTRPTGSDIVFSIIVFLIYMVSALAIGFISGFFTFGLLKAKYWLLIILPVSLLIFPSFVEELFFRVLLLPHKRNKMSNQKIILYALVSIFLFVVWHPLNASTINPAAYPIFTNATFLCIAALMAIACTVTYLKSGSIWIPVVIHWLTVLFWVFLLSGRNLILDCTTY